MACGDSEFLRVWDPATGTLLYRSAEVAGGVNAIAVSQGGDWLAYSGEDCTIRIIASTTGSPIASIRTPHPIQQLAALDKALFAVGAYGPYIFRLEDGQPDTASAPGGRP